MFRVLTCVATRKRFGSCLLRLCVCVQVIDSPVWAHKVVVVVAADPPVCIMAVSTFKPPKLDVTKHAGICTSWPPSVRTIRSGSSILEISLPATAKIGIPRGKVSRGFTNTGYSRYRLVSYILKFFQEEGKGW